MIDKEKLCEKIQQIYPEIGQCAINMDVKYDQAQKAWVVHLEKDGKKLETYLESDETDACMLGRKCVSLALQIEQLVHNIADRPETRQAPGV